MDTRKMELVLMASELGSFSELAKRTGLTQGGVSLAIKGVEDELGVRLFDRSRYGVKLTGQGSILIGEIKGVVDAWRKLLDKSKTSAKEVLTVASFTSVATNWLPAIIKEFEKERPMTRIELLNGDYCDIEGWIKNKSADVAFVVMDGKGKDTKERLLMRDELVAIAPKGFSRLDKEDLKPDDILKEDFITLLDTSNHDFYRALGKTTKSVNIKYKTKDDYQAIAMVEEGLGVSIMPRLLVDGVDKSGIEILPFNPKAYRNIGIRMIKESDGARAFIRICERSVKERETEK